MSSGKSWISPEAKTAPLLYVGGFQNPGYVNIYSQKGHNQAPIGQLTGFAAVGGLFVNNVGDLYVTVPFEGGVAVFHRGQTQQFEALSDAEETPYGVTEDSKGNVYVASTDDLGNSGGNIAVYAPGATSPTSTLSGPWFGVVSVAVDHKDNLYACYYTQNAASYAVGEFPHGSTTMIALGFSVTSCQGLAIDRNQNIVVSEANVPSVDVFPQGATMPSAVFGQVGAPTGLALVKSEKKIYVADNARNVIEEYSYPAGKLLDTISSGLDETVVGVAVDPTGKN